MSIICSSEGKDRKKQRWMKLWEKIKFEMRFVVAVLLLLGVDVVAVPFVFPRAGFVAPLPRMARPEHASKVENGWATGRSPSSSETVNPESLPPRPPENIELPKSPSPAPTKPEPQNRDYRKPPPFVEFNDVSKGFYWILFLSLSFTLDAVSTHTHTLGGYVYSRTVSCSTLERKCGWRCTRHDTWKVSQKEC